MSHKSICQIINVTHFLITPQHQSLQNPTLQSTYPDNPTTTHPIPLTSSIPPPYLSNKPPPGPITLHLLPLQLPIPPDTPPTRPQTKQHRKSTPRNNNPPSSLVPWLLRREEEVWREPMRDGRHAIRDGDERGSFCARARDDAGFPGYLDLSY